MSLPTMANNGSHEPWMRCAGRGYGMKHWLSLRAALAWGLAVAFMALAAPAHAEKARRAGHRQQRLQIRSQVAKGGQRRPRHGRYAQAARLFRDGGGEPDAAGVQRDPPGLRQTG